MLDLPRHSTLIMACHLTGVYDVNRNTLLPDDDYALVKEWVASVALSGLKGILFHNNFSPATCDRYQNEHISFIRVAHQPPFNPNVYRYFVYRDFLRQYAPYIDHLFVTDVSDVVVLNNPFIQPLFTANPDALFCGDEPKCLEDEWMKAHAAHLRSNISDYAVYEEKFGRAPLLNCGVIGGNILLMQTFMEQLCQIHQQYNADNNTAYTGDMGAFNYLLRMHWNTPVFHGPPVNTVFKAYQADRTDCWFRHK